MKKLLLLTTLFVYCFKIGYSQPGSPDPSFGKNGIVRTDIGSGVGYSSMTRQVLLLSDGSMYVIFELSGQVLITKKHSDGSSDSSYGTKILPVAIGSSHAALQADGKIIIAGTQHLIDGSYDFALARYNSNGSLDSTFSGDGHLNTDFNKNNDAVNSINIQSDGKILAIGITTSVGFYDDGLNVAIARYNADGSLDNTFNGDGRVSTQLETNRTFSSAIQTNGKLVVAGSGTSGLNISRFNLNGSVDSTFKFNVLGDNYPYFYSKSLAIQSDGKIVVGGFWKNGAGNNDFVLVRFNTGGSIDQTFGTNGIQTTDFRTYEDGIASIAIQSDEKIVAAGNASNGSNDAFAVARYNTNGSLDNTFDADGKKMTYITSNNVYATMVAIQSNGKLVLAGYEQSSTTTNIAIIRYNTDGSLDNTFHRSGTLVDKFKQKNTFFTGNAVQKDGKIVAVGYAANGASYDFAVARYNTDGSLDKTFSSDGIQTTNIGSSNNRANAVAIGADGKIVVAGYTSNGTNKDFAVVRYNTDGSLDKTFSADGIQTTDFGSDEEINVLAIHGDGKVVVAGLLHEQFSSQEYKTGLVRYNIDGSLDKSFSDDGTQKLSDDYEPVYPSGIAIQSDGKIIVEGTISYNGILARYNKNGSLDTTFGYNGKVNFGIPSEDEDGNYIDNFTYGASVTIQKDGKIIVSANYGIFKRNSTTSQIVIFRLNSDGNLDKAFNSNGMSQFSDLGNNPSIALQDNGKIVMVGNLYDLVQRG